MYWSAVRLFYIETYRSDVEFHIRAQAFPYKYKVYSHKCFWWNSNGSFGRRLVHTLVCRHRDNSLVHSSMKRWWSHSGAEEVDLRDFNICWTDVRAACSWTWRHSHMLHWHTCVEDHNKVTRWPLHTLRTWACQEVTLSNICYPEVTKDWDKLEDEVKSSCWDKCLH